MDLISFLKDEALIVIPVLWIVGAIIKKTPKIPDWIIPYVLLIVGIVITNALLGFSIEASVQGVLVSGTAVFGHQIYKQGAEMKLFIDSKRL
jgi:Na+-translocating ferredoxin:NAD+ oxidoreductase RnfD subunit